MQPLWNGGILLGTRYHVPSSIERYGNDRASNWDAWVSKRPGSSEGVRSWRDRLRTLTLTAYSVSASLDGGAGAAEGCRAGLLVRPLVIKLTLFERTM